MIMVVLVWGIPNSLSESRISRAHDSTRVITLTFDVPDFSAHLLGSSPNFAAPSPTVRYHQAAEAVVEG